MAKILSFRGKGTSDQTYLADEAEKLSFRTGEDGAVSLGDVPVSTLPEIFTDPRKNWTNQELADLFRVRHLLAGAGVAVETLHGVTDEGDPWFVFCHLSGDVFIHMARIDGVYVLDSPNVARPLRGVDFNALIADFTSDALPTRGAAAEGETTAHVVRLERGGKVRLHPSAMLAALIWTLFLAAEELVMMAPKEEAVPGADDLLDFTDIIAADSDIQAFEAAAADADGPSAADDFKIDHEETIATPDAAHSQMREVMGQQGLAMQQNAYAMGLSTIAIAMGFMSEVVLMDNQRKVLEGLKTLGLVQGDLAASDNPELDQIAGTSSDALLQKLADYLGLDLSLNTDMAEAPTAPAEDELLQQDMLHMQVDAQQGDALPAPKPVQTVARKDTDIEEAPQELTPVAPALAEAEALMLIAAAEQADKALNMEDILEGAVQLEEFQLGETTVMANFDIVSNNTLSDFLFVSTSGHQMFDHRAQSFLDHLNGKEEVGIITISNEVIVIDRAVFKESANQTYSFSWETYDGQVISMIGLRTEFEQFDLIA